MRFNLRLIFLGLFGLCFLFAIAGGLLWANLNFVHRVPGGADFYVVWRGGQNFLLHGDSPYQDLSNAAQAFALGHPVHEGQVVQRNNMPLYLFLVVAPIGLIRDVTLARAVWMAFLEIGLGELVWLVFQLSRWRPGLIYAFLLMLFGLAWSPSLIALFSGNLVIFQAALLFGALRALQLEADELAGAMIGLACFNLEVVGLLIILILLWVTSLNRLRVWGGFLMITVVLAGISIIFNVNWLLPYSVALLANLRFNPNPSTVSLLSSWLPGVGLRLAQGLALAVGVMLWAEWRAARGQDLHWLLWTVSLTAAATPLIGLPVAPLSLVLALPALLYSISIMEQRWGRFGRWSVATLLLVILLGLWAAWRADVGSVFTLIFPLLLILLLYWVRWWAIRPVRLWGEVIAEGHR